MLLALVVFLCLMNLTKCINLIERVKEKKPRFFAVVESKGSMMEGTGVRSIRSIPDRIRSIPDRIQSILDCWVF
jgi:hypothetical protein